MYICGPFGGSLSWFWRGVLALALLTGCGGSTSTVPNVFDGSVAPVADAADPVDDAAPALDLAGAPQDLAHAPIDLAPEPPDLFMCVAPAAQCGDDRECCQNAGITTGTCIASSQGGSLCCIPDHSHSCTNTALHCCPGKHCVSGFCS